MKKKNIIIFSGILTTMLTTFVYAKTDEVTLNKYETGTPIILNGEELKVSANYSSSKNQLRATWIATVANIDFPSKESLNDGVITKDEYMKDFTKILNRVQEMNLNTVIFQVSPMLDSWYKSDINPWSQYLTGKQGVEPNFGEWDSLKWSIEETHKRGLEFHAWINPYRVTNNPKDERSKNEQLADLADSNFAKMNPELVYEFNNKLYLNPGEIEVIDHVKNTVSEVIQKYDVDAIHFDDYFYPYKYSSLGENEDLPDVETFKTNDGGISDISEWRRDNVNQMIEKVSGVIDKYNKENDRAIEFGISPFGIWGHANKTEGVGSDTPVGSTSSYEDYVDSLKWAQEGWVDYLIPQIYWSFASNSAPYGELVDWWANKFSEIEESHLYIGHANYKNLTGADDTDWKNYDEILAQLRFNQKYEEVKGSSFFSFRNLWINEEEVYSVNNEFIKNLEKYFNVPANVPAKPWLDRKKTKPLKNIDMERMDDCIELSWDDTNKDSRFYVIYREDGNKESIDITNPNNIIGRIGREVGTSFKDITVNLENEYTYGVTILDDSGNETEPIIVSKVSKAEKNNISSLGLIIGGLLVLIFSMVGIILSTISIK